MLDIFEDLDDIEDDTGEIPKEYGFDFETGKMTGKIVTGIEALKIWAYFALRIQRYRFRQFTWAYGSQSEELIGKNYGVDYEISELRRYITDCLLVNPFISEVTDFVTEFEGTKLTASFRIVSTFGSTEMRYGEETN